jgi:hypothetical protein
MPVSLPERTVDAWVTAYVTKCVPSALIWAPTQRHTPDYDIAASVPGPGKLFVLEDKAPSTNHVHHFQLTVRQLWNYLRIGDLRSRTFYVLPCPPFSVTDVPGGPGARAASERDLVPRRAQFRLPDPRWPPCEEWFRVVPVMDLWTRYVGAPLPIVGGQWWPKRGPRPSCAPPRSPVDLTCPLPVDLGESLKVFMNRLLACDRPELRVVPGRSDERASASDDAQDSPLHQGLIVYAPAADLPGWID